MVKVILFFFFLSSILFPLYSQSTIDLSDVMDKKGEARDVKNSTSTSKKDKDAGNKKDSKKIDKNLKKKDGKKALDKSKNTGIHNKKNTRKGRKQKKIESKNNKYKFQKREEAVYKFDEKGNPVIPKNKIKKSTTPPSSTDLNIGIENQKVKLDAGGK